MSGRHQVLPSQASHATRQAEWAYWASQKWQELPYRTRLSEWKRHLAELDVPFDSFHDQAILDVGCGPVGIVFFLEARKGVGLDPLAGQYEQWNGYWGKRVDLVQAEGENIPFGGGSFDTVFCINVLDHTFNPAGVLREISRVLKPGGRIVLHTDLDSPLRKLHKLIKSESGVLHPQALSCDWIVRQLQDDCDIVKLHRDPNVFRPRWSQIRYEAFWDGLIYRLTGAKLFFNHIWLTAVKRAV